MQMVFDGSTLVSIIDGKDSNDTVSRSKENGTICHV
jgi:hypothetical protein